MTIGSDKHAYPTTTGAIVADSNTGTLHIFTTAGNVYLDPKDVKTILEASRYALGITPYAWAYTDSICEHFTTEQSEYRNQPGIESVTPLYAV